jgi:DNA replication protein DnaC
MARIQATFDPTSEESKHQVLDPVLQADVLVLDELGAQKPTQFVQDTLYLIINTRYCQRRTTLFTTNFRLKAAFQPESGGARSIQEREFIVDATEGRVTRHDLLTERLTPMLVSRIREMARPLVIETEDFRAQDQRKLVRR